jgi:hypothetical protein
MKIVHTMFQNGVVRDANGSLVAMYDRDKKVLYISNLELIAGDEVTAMDLVSDYTKEESENVKV